PRVTTFSDTARPRRYILRERESPEIERGVPLVKKRWSIAIACTIAGVSAWTLFWTYITNKEKISSSIVQELIHLLRNDHWVKIIFGDGIVAETKWWLNEHPRICGSVDIPQGYVDLSFRVEGNNGSETVYFTSMRRDETQPFEILRFKLVADDGTICKVDSENS
ncbi:cytochrome oxidase complex assembly protein 1-domain-containing protein, partial [Desarmillaria tabescens]